MAKTLGRKGGKAALPDKAKAPIVGRAAAGKLLPGPAEQELLERLAAHTGLLPREVLERALAAYAAAVAPGLSVASPKAARGPAKDAPARRLFLSIDGRPEVEVGPRGAVVGRDPACDLVLDLSLLSARHARFIPREGRWIFEDLHSARGSYRHGEKIDVRFLEDGDEIDLGGFLPVRVRLG